MLLSLSSISLAGKLVTPSHLQWGIMPGMALDRRSASPSTMEDRDHLDHIGGVLASSHLCAARAKDVIPNLPEISQLS